MSGDRKAGDVAIKAFDDWAASAGYPWRAIIPVFIAFDVPTTKAQAYRVPVGKMRPAREGDALDLCA